MSFVYKLLVYGITVHVVYIYAVCNSCVQLVDVSKYVLPTSTNFSWKFAHMKWGWKGPLYEIREYAFNIVNRVMNDA